nr:LysE family translocator [uncultured Acetobacter sp.]
MTWHIWWVFCGLVFFLCAIPGPNMLHVLNRSAHVGIKRCLVTMAGCLCALVTALVLSVAGLGAALTASPALFGVLRVGGAAYLIWLGIKAWRSSPEADTPPQADASAVSARTLVTELEAPVIPATVLWRDGFLVGISNPKLLLFAVAFFPQFINPQAPHMPQFTILVGTFVLLELFWYGIYATGGQGLSLLLTRPVVRKAFDRITGTIFIGFGAILLRGRI